MTTPTFITGDPRIKDAICVKGYRVVEKIHNLYIKRDLFDCCSYRFDGNWIVVEVPEGSSLYHGSIPLTHYIGEYPLGKDYMSNIIRDGTPIGKDEELKSNKGVQDIINQFGNPTTGWFSNPDTVSSYSDNSILNMREYPNMVPQCNLNKQLPDGKIVKSCILAYKFSKRARMLLLDDAYNVYKLFYIIKSLTVEEGKKIQDELNAHGLTDAKGGAPILTNESVEKMFLHFFGFNTGVNNLDNPGITDFNNQVELREKNAIRDHVGPNPGTRDTYTMVPINRFILWNKRTNTELGISRISQYSEDISFSYIFKILLSKYGEYDGYCSPRQYKFHDEMILFDSERVLDRDYNNPVDWQHNPKWDLVPLRVKDYIETIKKDVIINYKEYAGNIYECAVWCALYMEAILINPKYLTYHSKAGDPNIIKQKYDKLRNGVTEYGISPQLLSSISFLHNFGLRNKCELPNEYDVSLCDISIVSNIRSSYVPETVLEQLGIMTPEDRFLLYVLLDGFLEFNKIIDQQYNKSDERILNIIIGKNSLIYDINITDDIIVKIYIVGLLVTMCSRFTRSSILPGLQGLPPGGKPPAGGNPQQPNIYSHHLHLGNISKLYPGTTEFIDKQQDILDYVINTMTNVVQKKDKLMSDIKQIRNDVLDTVKSIYVYEDIYNKFTKLIPLTPEETKYVNLANSEMKSIRKQIDNLIKTDSKAASDLSINFMVNQEKIVNENRANGKPRGYSGYAIEILLGLQQSKLIHYTILGIITIKNNPDPPPTIIGSIQDRVWSAFNVARPILAIIFKTFSSQPYPVYRDHEIPRLNHNGVNHLRQCFFTGLLMINTNVVEKYKLNNADLILFLIVGYCMNLGRVNERGAIDNETEDMPILPDGWLSDLFPGQKQFGKSFIDYNVNQVPRYFANTNIMLYQILRAVQYYVDLENNATLYPYILSLSSSRIKDLYGYYGAMGEHIDKWINLVGLLHVGHYLDHCRPTTGYSQLNTKGDGGNAQGLYFVKQFLMNNIVGSDKPGNWDDIKLIFFEFQIRVIASTNGYKLPENWKDILATEIKHNKNEHCSELWKRTPVDHNMFLMTSKDFELLWNRIFYNSNINLGNWRDYLEEIWHF
jgi:hypothetical protein